MGLTLQTHLFGHMLCCFLDSCVATVFVGTFDICVAQSGTANW